MNKHPARLINENEKKRVKIIRLANQVTDGGPKAVEAIDEFLTWYNATEELFNTKAALNNLEQRLKKSFE
jgi:hypothetical protein